MAEFNPQFSTPTPNYLKDSKAIDQPYSVQAVDQSLAIGIKTAATELEGGVKLADSTIKSVISDKEDKFIRERRDRFIGQLDSALGNRGTNPSSDPMNARAEDGSTPPSQDLMPDTGAPAPSAVDRGIDTVERLQNARDQAGKFRTTSFDADIDKQLKSLRAQWPGYRDYIDQEASRIVGYNVANKLVSDKVAQLNELTTQSRAENDKVETFIKANMKVPGMSEAAVNFAAGKITKFDIYKMVNAYDVDHAKLEDKKLRWEAASADKNLSQQTAGDAGEAVVSHYVTAAYRYNRLANGQDPLQTAQEMHDQLVAYGTDPSKYPGDAAIVELQNRYEMARADATQKIQTAVFTPNAKTGKSLADDWGVDNANKFIKSSIEGTFGTTSKLFSSKDYALGESNQRRTAAVTSDTNMWLLHSSIGREAALSKAVAQDPALSAIVTNKLMTAKDFLPNINNFVESKTLSAVTQYDQSLGMKPATIKQDISDTKNTNGSDSEKAIAVKTFADVYKVVTDPKTSDKSKLNAATYLFDQSNKGFLQDIAKESIDAEGNPTKGQIDVFEQVTNPKLSEEMWKLSQRTDKTIWNKYTALAQHEFGVKMVTDIQSLNNLQDTSSILGGLWHYGYDDEEKQFIPLHADGTHLDRAEQTWFNPTYRVIENLNRGLKNLKSMAEVSGAAKDSVDAYIFQTLEQAGWSPKKYVEGTPAKLMNALLAAKGLPEKDTNAPEVPVSK